MRIVHVVRQFYPAIGGLEGVVEALARSQTEKGHQVRVVTLDRLFNAGDGPRLPRHDWLGRLEIVRVPYFGSKRYPIALSAIRHIKDADIVHVHGIDFFFDYLAWTKPFHGRTLVASTHGGFFHTGFAARLKRLYFKTVTRLSLRGYAGLAAVSASDHDLFSPLNPNGLHLIENGVNVEKFADAAAAAPAKSLVTIGRLSSNKRLDHAIRFLAALHQVDTEWTLTIAGRTWDVPVEHLRDLAERLGVAGSVRFLENPSDTRVREAVASASVFVSASDYEGFGLAVIEAMSAGLWPVISPIPPFAQLAKRTGLGTVTDFNDPEAAARQFLADWTVVSADHARYRRAAIEAAAQFGWRGVSAHYDRFYATVGGRHVRRILNVPILVKTSDEAIGLIDRQYERQTPAMVVFANAHTLNSTVADVRVQSALDRSIVFNDGIGVDLASRLLFGRTFPENLNGTDFIPRYLQASKHRHRIFLLGGQPGVAATAARRLAKMAPQHDFVGTCHGFFTAEEVARVVAQIRRSEAGLLLVAMGNPQQELWLNDHLAATGCRLGFGVGGLFDFMAEVVPRAPRWVQDARMEWAFRMYQQPKRLWRRYLVQMPLFLMRVSQQWLGGARFRGAASR